MKKKLTQQDRLYIKNRLKDAWIKTASPILIPKPKPQVVLSKKGNPLTKKQIKNKNKREQKLLWKLRYPNGKKKSRAKPKYAVYILSKEWRARCTAFYRKYGKVCVACGEIRNIHLHHMSYRHTGDELDEELAPLCRDCHHEYHELNGVQSNMIKKTVEFIEYKRQLLITKI